MTSDFLIFDCDGVLADTERDGHLPAFNETFEHFGAPIRWSQDDYAELLKIGGGKERLASVLTPELVKEAGLPTDPQQQRDVVLSWHKYKTARYTDMVRAGRLPGRPGVARLVAKAHDAGWGLAVASTSAEESVRAVLEHVVGADLSKQFSVFAGDVVAAKKPAPDIYQLALRKLDASPTQALVVEDSHVGLTAALAAGLVTVVTQSSYTADEDFSGAALVVSSLGDYPADATVVIDSPHGVAIVGHVGLDDLIRVRAAAFSSNSTPGR
ncbi:HAD-IA family hydrolase [Aeromicrobium sp. Root472D3]|uniref:HAD-IA family hydrolase n=1 Tax=Aeromicrobium sp. Root472D3 TaxID=1736540 RepID=UPI0006F4EBE9|nr:HAD-IA family hydrolase [Aeromicrobium sp. Root472D3]KQX74515.1 haloacid dehalogenase [Aeromicrobium sp. Root472D3]